MNSRKKQTVAVAMATALGASTMMSPVAVYAQEEDAATAITQDSTQEVMSQNETPVSEQGLPASEQPQELNTNSLSSGKPIIQSRTNIAFTDSLEAQQAIRTALADYSVSNATTQQDIQDFLRKEFVATGKLGGISVSLNTIPATPDSTGILSMDIIIYAAVPGTNFNIPVDFSHTLIIPRIPKTVAIDDTNFPDGEFRAHVSNFDINSDSVFSQAEINNIKKIDVSGKTGIKNLKGIEYFPALQYLSCDLTGVTDLNISNNINLLLLNCSNTGIQTLDVSNNPDLQWLYCFDTGIQTLDVSNNTALTTLSCYNTDIKELDVSKNPALKNLSCNDTGIQTLDVSNNTGLQTLDCSNTGIQTLDVSKNPDMTSLYCSNTPLAYLNLGNQITLNSLIKPSPSIIDFVVTSDSFDMTKAFAGIDISKVTNIRGATLNGTKLTDYKIDRPITYTYDCGTANRNPEILNVTLNPHKTDSEIQITGTLDTTYTGKPIDNPSVKTTGSTGAVTFTYEKWTGTGWEVVNDMPTDAGRYTVQAHLASDDYYNKAVSEKKEFTITQATNSWKNELAVADWTYGGQPSIPTATAKFGNPIFTYSDSKTGTFTSDVPVNAGTWYVKATVAGTNNYTGLESIHAFTILPKNIKDGNITVSDLNSDNDVKKLSVKDDGRELVKGTDYDVETKKDGNKTTITIAFKGNYAGTIERTYTVATSQPEKPEQKPQQDKPQEKPKDTDSVKTGDTTQTGFLATLGVLSVGCIAFLTGKRRKGKKD